MQPLYKAVVLGFDKAQKHHKIDLKSKEVLRPKVEYLDHLGSYLIELFEFLRSSLLTASRIFEACDWKPWPHQYKWIKDKDVFHNTTKDIGLEVLSKLTVVVDSTKDAKDIKTDILMQEIP